MGDEIILSAEEQAKIQEDIKNAQKNLVSEATQQQIDNAKKLAREEALKEVETKKILEEKDKEIEKLKQEQVAKETKTAEILAKMQKQIDDSISSKANVQVNDPFDNNNQPSGSQGLTIDSISDEQIDDMEERAAEQFFGDSYSKIKQLRKEIR